MGPPIAMPRRVGGRCRRLLRRSAGGVALLLLAACSSPNRGSWEGEFDGTVSGTVRFAINTRGTSLTGEMEGRTTAGDPFQAEMEGWLKGVHLEAEFAGSSQLGNLPAHFTGWMKGTLVGGEAGGEWEASMRFTKQSFGGTWSTRQLPPS